MFLKYLAAGAAKYCEKGAANQSGASAASLDSVKFQAVIKSAASAASRKPKIQGSPGDSLAGGQRPQGAPLGFGLPGGCASSRLDHGFKFYVVEHFLKTCWFTAE